MRAIQSCDQLGLCQRHKAACNGCEWKLAPGSVQGPFKRVRFVWLRKNWRFVFAYILVLVVAGALTAIFAFNLGYWGTRHG